MGLPAGIGGDSPLLRLIDRLFEAERRVRIVIPGANGELETTASHLTEGLIGFKSEAYLDLEAYNIAPQAVRDAHERALTYLNGPEDAFDTAWEEGVRALYPNGRGPFEADSFAALYRAHPVYEPLIDAVVLSRKRCDEQPVI